MARRIHDRVMLGVVVIVALIVLAATAALIGLFGSDIESMAREALANANTFARERLASFESLGKVAGLAITLLSGAYAIYQKYYFAEFNMHRRLREFQQRFDARLKDSNKHIDRAVLRPSPVREFESAIFTDDTLNPVLKKMKWGKRPAADESLETTLRELDEQLNLWAGQKREYEKRKAQACLLKGAIAAARAAKTDGADAQTANVEALEHFQEAFKLSNDTDTEALEYIGHQQVRLGDYGTALGTFEKLAEMAPEGEPSLSLARALKFQAEVYECKPQPNLVRANSALMKAVEALPANAPYLDKAELHEMHGRAREKLRTFNVATQSYRAAEFWYLRIINENNSIDETAPIAKAGLQRVRDATYRIQLGALTQGESENSIALAPNVPQDAL